MQKIRRLECSIIKLDESCCEVLELVELCLSVCRYCVYSLMLSKYIHLFSLF